MDIPPMNTKRSGSTFIVRTNKQSDSVFPDSYLGVFKSRVFRSLVRVSLLTTSSLITIRGILFKRKQQGNITPVDVQNR